jgi:hypothetical protein
MKLTMALILSLAAISAQAGDAKSCAKLAEWPDAYKLCLKPDARIGMTREQVISQTNWGKPEKVYKTTTALGTSEQWRYIEGSYLFFSNGKLTSVHN